MDEINWKVGYEDPASFCRLMKNPAASSGVSKDLDDNFPNVVTPECIYRGSRSGLAGFPLKACGNDGFRMSALLDAASCGE